MCGISGLIGIENYNCIKRMVDVQTHRGPDDSGIEVLSQKPPVYFGHNRLSIIDLSARGHQPMYNEDKTLCIAYNGEVYNFQEIRKELINYGYHLISATDTEVILKAYDRWGADCLKRFNGMFALAIFDKRRRRITLARDRLGIKPLYYWLGKKKLAFASEIKALLQVEEVKKTISLDMEAFVSYVSMLWCPNTKTPFTSIRRLPQGSFMEIDLDTGEHRVETFWKLHVRDRVTSFSRAKEGVLDLLTQSVKRRMIADVKVGGFLSGGLDSSVITTLMAQQTSEPLEAFTIAFSKEDQQTEAMMDDYKYAKKLSDKLGFNLNKITASSTDAAELLPKIIYHLDEPVGDPAAINTYLMAKLAREKGTTILLSGQGSDEIFGGYRRYIACLFLERYKKIVPKYAQVVLNRIISKMPVAIGSKGIRWTRWMKRLLLDKPDDLFGIYYSICNFISIQNLSKILNPEILDHITDRVHRHFFESFESSYLNRMCYTDTMLFLPGLNLNYCDKATMAASIECRVPFVDHELVEYAFSLPDDYKVKRLTQKYVLKKALKGVLPQEIIYRPKMPFSSPIRSWVKKGLKPLIDEYLDESRISKQGLFNANGIKKLIDEDRRGVNDNAHVIYGLLTMQIWLDVFSVI